MNILLFRLAICQVRILAIDINTSGLPARNIFAWILRYQLKITADEY